MVQCGWMYTFYLQSRRYDKSGQWLQPQKCGFQPRGRQGPKGVGQVSGTKLLVARKRTEDMWDVDPFYCKCSCLPHLGNFGNVKYRHTSLALSQKKKKKKFQTRTFIHLWKNTYFWVMTQRSTLTGIVQLKSTRMVQNMRNNNSQYIQGLQHFALNIVHPQYENSYEKKKGSNTIFVQLAYWWR